MDCLTFVCFYKKKRNYERTWGKGMDKKRIGKIWFGYVVTEFA